MLTRSNSQICDRFPYDLSGFAAWPDGPWHDGWVNPEIAAQTRQTVTQFTAILLREQRSQDQELRG